MKDLFSLANTYFQEEMYHASLALSEYVYRKYEEKSMLVMMLKSMYKLGYYERCAEVIERNSSIVKIYDVRLVYYKCKSVMKNRIKTIVVARNDVDEDEGSETHEYFQMNRKSVELLFEGLTKEDIRKKEVLLEAYGCDWCNLEALLRATNEDLICEKELLELVKKCGDEHIREAYTEIFCPKFDLNVFPVPFYSPWYGLMIGKQYYKDKKSLLLFNLGASMFRLYPNSEFSFVIIGLFFLLSLNYTEARRCFYKAIQINGEYGRGWLYLGMAYSGMKECESSISCLNTAHKMMPGSYKPAFYLAIEYHRMNNFEHASFFYKQALGMNKEIQVQMRYISLLIYYEYYTEALSYLATQKSNSFGLLRVYCNLFLGKVSDAQKHLSTCTADWRYYATAGFIDHLMNRLESAADNYSKALLKTNVNHIVEELLGLAVENMAHKQSNNVYDYATDLFDSIITKNTFEII